jgi:hypothetical protein
MDFHTIRLAQLERNGDAFAHGDRICVGDTYRHGVCDRFREPGRNRIGNWDILRDCHRNPKFLTKCHRIGEHDGDSERHTQCKLYRNYYIVSDRNNNGHAVMDRQWDCHGEQYGIADGDRHGDRDRYRLQHGLKDRNTQLDSQHFLHALRHGECVGFRVVDTFQSPHANGDLFPHSDIYTQWDSHADRDSHRIGNSDRFHERNARADRQPFWHRDADGNAHRLYWIIRHTDTFQQWHVRPDGAPKPEHNSEWHGNCERNRNRHWNPKWITE